MVVYNLCTKICQITILSFQYNFLLNHFTLSENVADPWRKIQTLFEKKKRLERPRDRPEISFLPFAFIKKSIFKGLNEKYCIAFCNNSIFISSQIFTKKLIIFIFPPWFSSFLPIALVIWTKNFPIPLIYTLFSWAFFTSMFNVLLLSLA